MVDADTFKAAWTRSGDRLCTYARDDLSASVLPDGTKHFLQVAGLPDEAAPFLSFKPLSLGWLDAHNRGYPIGSDGNGNPIVVDEGGIVWLIDHEAPTHASLVNSTVGALADCLISYRALVTETIPIGGDDAFLDGRVPKHLTERFAASVSASDPAATQPGTFWGGEVSRLIADLP